MADISFARRLRRTPTPTEQLVWRWLRHRRFAHVKFRRQHPFGPFILDFYCFDLKLAIEVDGAGHVSEDEHLDDVRRDRYLAQHGVTVIRFWNDDIRDQPEGCADRILAAMETLTRASRRPLPPGEGSV